MQMLRSTVCLSCVFLKVGPITVNDQQCLMQILRVRQSREYRLRPRAVDSVVGTWLRHIVTRVVRLVVQGVPVGAVLAAGSSKFESHEHAEAGGCRRYLTYACIWLPVLP